MKPKYFIWSCIKWPLFLAWSLFMGSVAHSLASDTQFDAPWYAWSLVMSTVSISAFAGYRAKAMTTILEAFGKEFELIGTRFNQIEELIRPTDPEPKRRTVQRQINDGESPTEDPPAENPTAEWDLKCEHCSRPMRLGATKCGYCWRERNPL